MKLTIIALTALILSACGTPIPDSTTRYCAKFKTAGEQALCYDREKPTGGNAN